MLTTEWMDHVMLTLRPSGTYHVTQMFICLAGTYAAALQLLGNAFIGESYTIHVAVCEDGK